MLVTDNYVFFWKDKIAQWNMQSFVDNLGMTYVCAEQYMMAKKALLFKDYENYENIMMTKSPKEHQAFGRLVKNFDQKIWEANAAQIVYQGNYFKFSQNPDLKEILMGTKGKILVEASPFDLIWGIGYGVDTPLEILEDPSQWKGKNLLGWTLTSLRDNAF